MKVILITELMIVTMLSACNKNSFNESSKESDSLPTAEFFESLDAIGIDSSDSLKLACSNEDKRLVINEKAISLSYPKRANCSWDSGQNLGPLDRHVQAFETSTGELLLPANTVLCEISMNSKNNAIMHYDDFLFLRLESHVIFGSNSLVTDKLEQNEGTYRWDWTKIKGEEIVDFEAQPYCITSGEFCQIPPHDQQGPIALSLKPEDIANISFQEAGKTKLNLDLIATGDNDPEDCMHTELELDVVIKYIQL